MIDLMTTKDIVAELLEEDPRTRDSDDILYLQIIRRNGLSGVSVDHFFQNRKSMGIPPFESVRRARQKVQEENPELCGKNKEQREEAQKAYYEFALTDGGDGHGKKAKIRKS